MKIGAEDKRKVIIMAVLLVIAVPLLIHSYTVLRPSTPSAAAAPKTPAPAAPRATQKKSTTGIPKVREGTLDPTLRTDLLAASQKIEYTGRKRNIFKVAEPPPPPIPPADTGVRQKYVPPPPPPQIPLVYYGFSNQPGEPKKAFLRNGEGDIFVAVEGQVVQRRYKILKITNTSVLVEDVLANYQQMINLTLPQSG